MSSHGGRLGAIPHLHGLQLAIGAMGPHHREVRLLQADLRAEGGGASPGTRANGEAVAAACSGQ